MQAMSELRVMSVLPIIPDSRQYQSDDACYPKWHHMVLIAPLRAKQVPPYSVYYEVLLIESHPRCPRVKCGIIISPDDEIYFCLL